MPLERFLGRHLFIGSGWAKVRRRNSRGGTRADAWGSICPRGLLPSGHGAGPRRTPTGRVPLLAVTAAGPPTPSLLTCGDTTDRAPVQGRTARLPEPLFHGTVATREASFCSTVLIATRVCRGIRKSPGMSSEIILSETGGIGKGRTAGPLAQFARGVRWAQAQPSRGTMMGRASPNRRVGSSCRTRPSRAAERRRTWKSWPWQATELASTAGQPSSRGRTPLTLEDDVHSGSSSGAVPSRCTGFFPAFS